MKIGKLTIVSSMLCILAGSVWLSYGIITTARANVNKNINLDVTVESASVPKISKLTTIIPDTPASIITKDVPEYLLPISPDIFNVSSQNIAPFITSLETKKPVIFLGIDDGVVKNPEAIAFFKKHRWPVTLFLNQNHVDENPQYFKDILITGANLGDHTNTHPNLAKMSYKDQKKEICASQETSKTTFGITPKLFRPPYGNYNQDTLKAAKECGLIATIGWKARVDEGKVWFQSGNKLNRGDIVLMHFRPQIMDDLKAFEAEITKQQLAIGNLEEWVK
jgi:peptidoglycan/xylan/chitin deacetylase (PgdA/CDA1 family)